VRQEPGEVVGTHLRGRVLVRIVDRTSVDAARVGGEHGVVSCEQVGHRREGIGVHRGADEQHERSLAAHLVVQARARDPEGTSGGGNGRGEVHRVLLHGQ